MKKRRKFSTMLTLLMIVFFASDATPQNTPTLRLMSWLSGCWEGEKDGEKFDEIWMTQAGGAMLGVGRTLRDGKMTDFEFMQIRQQNDSVIYIAQPQGHPPVSFKMLSLDRTEGVFQNTEHDFPQRIIYKQLSDGSLFARIEGKTSGNSTGFDFPMKRVKCDEHR